MIKYIEFALFPIFILSTHWVAMQFYSTYCVSSGLLGYLISYITVSSPICSFCFTILERTGNIYYAIWLSFSIIIIRFFTTLATNILTNK